MRTKKFYLIGLLTLAILFTFSNTSCKKDTSNSYEDKQMDSKSIDLLLNDVDNSYQNMKYQEGDELLPFFIEDEGLPEAYTLVETDMDDAGYKRGKVKRHFKCLVSLNLSDTQITALRKNIRAYEDCKFSDLRSHRDSLLQLIRAKEQSRRDLLDSFKNGNISRPDFQKALNDIKKEFKTGIKDIRLNHSKHLRDCYKSFLIDLQMILTKQQWDDFIDCYK